MDLKEILKLHILSNVNKNSFRGLLAFALAEEACRHAPSVAKVVGNALGNVLNALFFRKRGKGADVLSSSLLEEHLSIKKSSIILEHIFDDADESPDQLMEALVSKVSGAEGVTDLKYVIGRFLIDFRDPFEVAGDIYCQLLDAQVIQSKSAVSYKITLCLFSPTKSVYALREFVDMCRASYDAELQNKLGDRLYIFDNTSTHTPGSAPLLYNPHVGTSAKAFLANEPPALSFTKHLFVTSRTFENIFYDQKAAVQARVDFFLHHKSWYDAKGVPHTLGLLFHGLPGCGKTSTIKAIANVAKRHVVNVNMAAVKTKSQLINLFYNDELTVTTQDTTSGRSSKQTFNIPIEKRLYVLEDFDCMGNDLVLDREFKSTTAMHAMQECVEDKMEHQEAESDLTLSVLLNVLDGVLETPGRIVVYTTNCVDRIEKALIRPGRVDMIVKFDKASVNTTREMYESFFDSPWSMDVEDPPAHVRTPAEIGAILFQNFGDAHQAMADLIKYPQ